METFDKISKNQSIPPREEGYRTLEKIDFTDIAQAIDGSRSKPKEDQYKTIDRSDRSVKSRRFWFW